MRLELYDFELWKQHHQSLLDEAQQRRRLHTLAAVQQTEPGSSKRSQLLQLYHRFLFASTVVQAGGH
jgi:hypothetical protein